MSDTTAASSQPAGAAVAKHSIPVIVWLIVLLVAATAFGGAVLLSGGVDEALNLVGLGSLTGASSQQSTTPQGSKSSKPAGSAAATSTATVSKSSTASPAPGLPASARSAMFREQLQSQVNIGKLVNNQVASLRLGTPKQFSSSATVPVTVKYRNGSSLSGVMTLKKYKNVWYFFRLTATGNGTAYRRTPIDSSVISVITRQQATKGNQDLITKGILGGGFKTARVTGVSKGSGTATVKVALSGGSAPTKNGQFVCISKRTGSSTYWFLVRFAAK